MTAKQNGHILIVDDEFTNRDLLQLMLARQGYHVSLASGGEQALELIKVQSFDLVLLDIMMPDVDGIAVLKAARQLYSMTELPIIMATALDQNDQVATCLSLGANDYITKPFTKRSCWHGYRPKPPYPRPTTRPPHWRRTFRGAINCC
jgi:CheY-like chemotaxis protein